MINVSVKNIKLFEVIDETAAATYCGGWQEWYGDVWKRMSGCGPTTVANIMNYLCRSCAGCIDCPPLPKNDFQTLMEAVWRYVTPGVRGIPSTSALIKGAAGYIASENLDFTPEELDIPKNKNLRPAFAELAAFLSSSLKNDAPVAFLSLDNGKEKRLENWHWVTLLSLEYEEDGSAAFAGIADEGVLFRVDLKKWYDTSSLGGGFVRFARS